MMSSLPRNQPKRSRQGRGDPPLKLRTGKRPLRGLDDRPRLLTEHPRLLLSDGQWHAIADVLGLCCREFEIVQFIFQSKSEAEIATELGISIHTVHTYIRRLYQKLGIGDHCQLIIRVFAVYISLQTCKTRRRASDRPKTEAVTVECHLQR